MSRLFAILLLSLTAAVVHAQSSHESLLTLHVDQARIRGEWQVPLLDLDAALSLDSNRDGDIAWPEIENRRKDIEEALDANLRVLADGANPGVHFDKLTFGTRQGEPFVMSEFSAIAPRPIEALDVDYTLLFEQRPEHRASLKVIWEGSGSQRVETTAPGGATIFSRANVTRTPFPALLKSGVWHIWIGYDHVLFLLVLLIPAVLRRTPNGREAATDFSGSFLRVIVIVSAFTVAHSITLSCAALGWIVLPARLVESAIAASVFVAALVNLLPRTAGASGVWIAFGFGLLHGFGFANVLSEVGAEGEPILRTLLGFNLGVELGQLAIVAVFLPIAYLLRGTRFYRTGVVYGGSSAAAACAMFWLWQRAL
ncbi:HupE/UreJ family protein [Peristeroidobacter soli]|uniref:HupE/UreJ family protein n=1 Tax=Peristeroidobacter soli TaxID=2497877 RepID=UPI00101D1A09|nr:HupE/UreJ family protein [Peristeroidobacter soli]